MKAPLDDAATEPDGLVRIPASTEERSIGALLEGLDDPQPVVKARVSGSDLNSKPRAQLDTALLPDVDRRKRRKGAVIGLVLGLSVTLVAGTLSMRTVFATRDADAAGPAVTTPLPVSVPVPVPVRAAPAGTWTTPVAPMALPVTPPPTAALTDLPVVAAPTTPSASAAAPSTAKRPAHPASSSSPGEPRRGYGLTSDEP